MGEKLKELSLDAGSNFVPKIISDILTEVSVIEDFSQKLSKLDFHVNAFEEELKKINVFKRELPICMHLLKDAIEKLKEEELQLKGEEVRPVMEQFIPLKRDSNEIGRDKRSGDFSEKKNWMSSAQLWSTPVLYENNFDSKNQDSGLHLRSRYEEEGGIRSEYQQQVCNFGNRGGAFVPFKKSSGGETKEDNGLVSVQDLTLSSPVIEMESCDLSMKGKCGNGRVQQQHEAPRKQRRCWSPELHKKFVDALHQLGGAQAATPKQIRELMKVDGLTNDEVKSHLQKYRLHIQKLPSSSAAVSSSSWFTQEQYGDLLKAIVTHSGSPQGPLNHGGSTKGVSVNDGDSMEDDEDDKSESHSKKSLLQQPVEDHV
ncbi:transcription factor HHO5-like isoform X1 [Olea europaea var. sylvestris]|uniref:transcription factor HHO5-like isoform X1 n=1 Tax=Olea europaea var. sylvestris TaxID=158386 RepID=UPI000C1CFFA2|nr:transcription factor HHO5-like isoform X1 [Olea europaea var. sylvestris]